MECGCCEFVWKEDTMCAFTIIIERSILIASAKNND